VSVVLSMRTARGNPCVVVGGFSLIITKGTQRGTLLKDLKIHLFNLCR
jgi:hypothetical protein